MGVPASSSYLLAADSSCLAVLARRNDRSGCAEWDSKSHPNVAKGGDVRMGYPVFFSFSVLFLWADLQLFRGEYAGSGQSCRGESLIGREHEPGAAAVAYAAAVGAELIEAIIAGAFDGIAEGDGDVSVFVAGDRRDVDGRRESSDGFSREVALLHAHGGGTEVGADEE